MNTIEILKKLTYGEYFLSFLYYDGVPYLYIMKHENKYFMYFWVLEDIDDNGKGITVFAIVELDFQDLNDILNKKYPIAHYYKTRKTYAEKTYFRVGKKEVLNVEVCEYTLNEEEWPVEDFFLDELQELNGYIINEKMKGF